VVECAGEEDENSYDMERLKKPVEVDSLTVGLPSTTPTRFNGYVINDVTSGFHCTHCGQYSISVDIK